MTHKHYSLLYVLTCSAFLIVGIGLLSIVASAQETDQGSSVTEFKFVIEETMSLRDAAPESNMSLSEKFHRLQNGMSLAPAAEVGMTLDPEATHAAAPARTESGATMIVAGMLLILAGFGLHAMYVVRQERPVRVTQKKKKKSPKKSGYIEYFWMKKLWP